jgi:hypothetical protein
MKKLLIIIALLASAKTFAQSESDRLKDNVSYTLDHYGPSEVLIIDNYGTAFSLDDYTKSVCGDQYYAKIIAYPYSSRGKVLGCETLISILEKVGNGTYTQAAILNSKLRDLYDSDYHDLPVTGLKDKFGDIFYALSPDDCEKDHVKNICGDLWTRILFPFGTGSVQKVLGCESPESILDKIYSGVYEDYEDGLSNINSALYVGIDAQFSE